MKRLEDINLEDRNKRPAITPILPMKLGDDEASRRVIMHSARKVIRQHKDELIALAYK